MQVAGENEDFVEIQQLVNHAHQGVRFARAARPADQHPEIIRRHARVPLLIATGGQQVELVISESHLFYIPPPKTMSVQKWRVKGTEEAALEKQRDEINRVIKEHKYA